MSDDNAQPCPGCGWIGRYHKADCKHTGEATLARCRSLAMGLVGEGWERELRMVERRMAMNKEQEKRVKAALTDALEAIDSYCLEGEERDFVDEVYGSLDELLTSVDECEHCGVAEPNHLPHCITQR